MPACLCEAIESLKTCSKQLARLQLSYYSSWLAKAQFSSVDDVNLETNLFLHSGPASSFFMSSWNILGTLTKWNMKFQNFKKLQISLSRCKCQKKLFKNNICKIWNGLKMNKKTNSSYSNSILFGNWYFLWSSLFHPLHWFFIKGLDRV